MRIRIQKSILGCEEIQESLRCFNNRVSFGWQVTRRLVSTSPAAAAKQRACERRDGKRLAVARVTMG